jgi:hypothetical protein
VGTIIPERSEPPENLAGGVQRSGRRREEDLDRECGSRERGVADRALLSRRWAFEGADRSHPIRFAICTGRRRLWGEGRDSTAETPVPSVPDPPPNLTSYRRIFSKSHGARLVRRRPPPLWVKGRPPRPGRHGPCPSGPGPPAPGWRWRRRYGRLRDRV